MAIVIDGVLEQMLRTRLAKWREADERYLGLKRPGVDPAALVAAIHDSDSAARPLVMLLSAVVE